MRFFTAIFLVASALCASAMPTEHQIQETLATSYDHFSSEMYKHTAAEKPGENLVMSPMSVQVALASLSMGSEGKTLKELNTVLGMPDKEFTKVAYKSALKTMLESDDSNRSLLPHGKETPPTFDIVNKVYVKKGCELSPTFKSTAMDVFLSDTEAIDFAKNTKAAATINSWVESKTNKKICDFIKPQYIGQDTRMVLVNAVYFKASWAHRFHRDFTKKDDFFVGKGKKVKADMMTATAFFETATVPEWNAEVIKLPFEASELSMVIVVPKEADGLATVERKITTAGLTSVIKKLKSSHNVDLTMPKFKIESKINLKKILPKMGVEKMFKTDAEFAGILKTPEHLYVSEAVQKAYIDVDEDGCEAAAATGFGIAAVSMPIPFKIDVPFYYAIMNDSGAKLFTGRFLKPL